MWATVLVLALISATEPTRIGITAMLIAFPRPMRNLLAYWLGLMSSASAVALISLFVLRDFILPIVNRVNSVFENPVVPPIQIGVGVAALSVAAVIAKQSFVRPGAPVRVPMSGPGTVLLTPEKPNLFTRLGMPGLLENGSAKVSYLVGFFSSIPPVEFWGAMMAILAAETAAGTRVSAALMFLLVGFAIAEIPLVAYLASPAKTQRAVTQLHLWLRTNRRTLFLSILGVFGAMMVAGGTGFV